MSVALLLKTGLIFVVIFVMIVVLAFFDLVTQVSRYRAYWQRQNARFAGQQIEYVALGDSTAQGIGASHPSNSYVGIIRDELARKKGSEVAVVNLSKTGATIRHAIDIQLPAMQKLDLAPSAIITIQIGANDIREFNAASFESGMDELMAALPKQALITDIPYFGVTRARNLEGNVQDANKIMHRLAKKHDFKLVALHQRIHDHGSLKTVAVDMFHPSSYSYRHDWAYLFLKRLHEDS